MKVLFLFVLYLVIQVGVRIWLYIAGSVEQFRQSSLCLLNILASYCSSYSCSYTGWLLFGLTAFAVKGNLLLLAFSVLLTYLNVGGRLSLLEFEEIWSLIVARFPPRAGHMMPLVTRSG